jgi:predicted TPR repeat methyltransferase
MGQSDSWLGKGSTKSGEVADYYDEWADSYEESVGSWQYNAPRRSASLIREHAEHTGSIFDAGCGTGLTGRALKDEGFDTVIGTDISPESVAIAAKSGVYDRVTVLDLQAFPFPFTDNHFSAVNCIGVLTYIGDTGSLLEEFIRVTRDRGLVVFTHRTDIIASTDFYSIVDGIEADGRWEKVLVSDPQPYLPGNEDFADKIHVVYFVYRVTKE